MTHVKTKTNGGARLALAEDAVTTLRSHLRGDLVLAGASGYDDARAVWNAMVDKHPALIVRCAAPSDVVAAVNFAREGGLPLAVRGGGHNIAGSAVCDDGVVVDLSPMRAAIVNLESQRVTVEGGATLADLDAATQAHGLATPVGINSTTGIAGLTLGGGFGWLSRKHGMTVDNLLSADVVTAAGEQLRASATENPDLFWALRGGSGNFGVVTRFEFQLHPVGPELLSGLVVYPIAEAGAVLRRYAAFMAAAPDELTVWAVLRLAPPLPFLPESVHGTGIIALAALYTGDPETGRALLEPVRRFGTPVGEHLGVQPYTAWQQTFDPLLTAGARNYWKSHNLTALSDGAIDTIVEYAGDLPSPQTEIFIAALGGAVAERAPDATAYAHRDVRYVLNVHGRWEAPVDDERVIAWARAFFGAAAPFATGGVYVNFLTEDERERVRAAYGPSYERLAQVKRRYDPENLFRTNQNIAPLEADAARAHS